MSDLDTLTRVSPRLGMSCRTVRAAGYRPQGFTATGNAVVID